MKRILVSAIFTVAVGLLSAQAQDPVQNPTDKDQNRVTQDTVIDNSNIPDTAGSVIDDGNMIDTTSTLENKNAPKEKSDNLNLQPADKVKVKPKKEMK